MERSSEYHDLATTLAELRPTPPPDFAAELDERVAAGFPRRSRFGRSPFSVLAARLRGLPPQRLLFATCGTALAALAVATALVASIDSGPTVVNQNIAKQSPGVRFSEEMPRLSKGSAENRAAGVGDSSGVHSSSDIQSVQATSASSQALRSTADRDVERSARIALLADPADVADDSAEVFAAVHDTDGIVLHSTTTEGEDAGARFDLLIPSAKLGDALAALSAIDEVRTRHEGTDDITAPTLATGERLRDSRARIDSLLTQLASAESETEMEAVEVELRDERRHAARLRAQLVHLHRRADFSHVSLRIETGSPASDSEGAWGVDNALGNAGHILTVAAGVTLLALAVLAPLSLLFLLAWLAHRLWLRTSRARALDA
ncbi:MAG TPA: DUF4349 domain-containing protein [Solirubrobacterales bacterium]